MSRVRTLFAVLCWTVCATAAQAQIGPPCCQNSAGPIITPESCCVSRSSAGPEVHQHEREAKGESLRPFELQMADSGKIPLLSLKAEAEIERVMRVNQYSYALAQTTSFFEDSLVRSYPTLDLLPPCCQRDKERDERKPEKTRVNQVNFALLSLKAEVEIRVKGPETVAISDKVTPPQRTAANFIEPTIILTLLLTFAIFILLSMQRKKLASRNRLKQLPEVITRLLDQPELIGEMAPVPYPGSSNVDPIPGLETELNLAAALA